jgi:uncharacterized membrane protein YhaH (DUF805 family)
LRAGLNGAGAFEFTLDQNQGSRQERFEHACAAPLSTKQARDDTSIQTGLWRSTRYGFHSYEHQTYLLLGLTWFDVRNVAPLYMTGLAFTAYGIHWFAMAHRRYIDASAQPDGWMAIAFLFISILGVDVFRSAGDIPVMIIFVGLALIYAVEIPTRFFPGVRVLAS